MIVIIGVFQMDARVLHAGHGETIKVGMEDGWVIVIAARMYVLKR